MTMFDRIKRWFRIQIGRYTPQQEDYVKAMCLVADQVYGAEKTNLLVVYSRLPTLTLFMRRWNKGDSLRTVRVQELSAFISNEGYDPSISAYAMSRHLALSGFRVNTRIETHILFLCSRTDQEELQAIWRFIGCDVYAWSLLSNMKIGGMVRTHSEPHIFDSNTWYTYCDQDPKRVAEAFAILKGAEWK